MGSEFSLRALERKSNIMSILACIRNKEMIDRPIILFGAGSWGREYLNSIRDYFKTILFCDNDTSKWGTFVDGIQIINFDQLKNVYMDSYITVTSLSYYDQISLQLFKHGMEDRMLPPLYGFTDPEFADYYNTVREHESEFAEAYKLLDDDYSRQVFYNRINALITGNNKYLFPLRSKSPQYFEKGIIALSNKEILVDGGAYIGDTVEEFLKQTTGEFEKIYSFEPEQTKHSAFLQEFSNPNIELFPYGLWKENDVLKFEALDSGSSGVNVAGSMEIKVVSLDNILKGAPVTFIKMDIEGSELEALIGAKETIKKYKPKLAICIYHKPLDIVQIPLFLKELVPDYKIYMRHYNINIFETVCYAVVD
ncbi:FkbM family methyltransferase [Paenibacillus sp. NPDC057934]|uniref:FkbM family methyltransferase n=1 Tax=Paenibacillus sp. NPDC057934 TaxID=3346282 RepID=UPI0036D93A3C